MKNKVLARVLSVLLCVCVFCTSFTLTVFAAPAISELQKFWAMFIVPIIELNEQSNEFKSAQANTTEGFKARSEVLAKFKPLQEQLPSNLSESDFLELMTWFCTSSNSSLIEEKYGRELMLFYVEHEVEFSDFLVYCIMPLFVGLEDFVHMLYTEDLSNYKITDNGGIQVPSSVVKDYITDTNTMFFPKNTGGKMSYRTDKRWHNKYDGTNEKYLRLSLYESFNGFTAVGGDEIYFIFFYKTADDTYYGSYQFHITVTTEEKWFEDRDEVEFTYYQLKGEYWDMVEGSADKRTDFTPTKYYDGNNWLDFSTNPYEYLDFSFDQFQYVFHLYSSYTRYISYDALPRGSIGCAFPTIPAYNSDMSLTLNITDSLFNSFDKTSDYTDIGYLASTTPIETIYKIDTSKIPDNYRPTAFKTKSTQAECSKVRQDLGQP